MALRLNTAQLSAPKMCEFGVWNCGCQRCDWSSPQPFNKQTGRFELRHAALPHLNIFVQKSEYSSHAGLLAYLFHHLNQGTQKECDTLMVRYKTLQYLYN